MISRLTGTIAHSDTRFVTLDVSGVGYKVFATTNTVEKLSKGSGTVSLWTHLSVREDALDLYGFTGREELEFFQMLISVSGIGPKSALSILNIANIEDLKQAIATGDTTHLTKVSGIGSKNAEKIVLELRGKVGAREEKTGEHMKDEVDAIEALKALGYSHSESREALKKVPKETTGTSEKVKRALKNLNSSSGRN